jgi:hypothetical protein
MTAIVPYVMRTFVPKGSLDESNYTLLDYSCCPLTLAQLMRAITLYTMIAVVPNGCTLDNSNCHLHDEIRCP